eukprot:TRINITY_DN10711_c0_g1_i1.p1 TRINITY_DN10711_c0_g1~~TRINITY_DN10711_c0_g1_i1.p1  ORF type:complete len:315 (+),score=69.94 TRINITY_DN10711_c0_g1_i1:78-947(+)
MSVTYNAHGKAAVKVVKVVREGSFHKLYQYTVMLVLSGKSLETSYTEGSNEFVVPTDTCKNLIYVIAKETPCLQPETYARDIAERALASWSHVEVVNVTVQQHPWSRIPVDGQEHKHSFFMNQRDERTAHIEASRSGASLKGGFENLTVLKTTNSGFTGFPRCKYTSLPEMKDRILSTNVTCTWTFNQQGGKAGADLYQRVHDFVRSAFLKEFASTYSVSVQKTLYDVCNKALVQFPELEKLKMTLPNKHHWLFDLEKIGIKNDNEVFIAATDPFGVITCEVSQPRSRL